MIGARKRRVSVGSSDWVEIVSAIRSMASVCPAEFLGRHPHLSNVTVGHVVDGEQIQVGDRNQLCQPALSVGISRRRAEQVIFALVRGDIEATGIQGLAELRAGKNVAGGVLVGEMRHRIFAPPCERRGSQ